MGITNLTENTTRRFEYRRAQPQQELGGKTWRVVKDIVRRCDGQVTATVVEKGLPHKTRAVRLAKTLNLAL